MSARVFIRPSVAHLSLGVFADLSRHVVGALDERAGDVVIIHRDDGERDQEVNQEDHHRVDLRMHLIGQRVGHAVHEGDVSVVPVTLRGEETRRRGEEGKEKRRGDRGEKETRREGEERKGEKER